MVSILRSAWDTLTEIIFPSCVWGGHVGTPGADSTTKPTRAARFRLDLEVLEPRMALAANPLIEPLATAQPFVLGDLPYAESELRSDAALGSSIVTVIQQAQPDYRIESRNTVGLMVAIYGRDAGSDAFDLFAQRYDAVGHVQGDALQVNVLSRGSRAAWSVAIDEQGDFVVAWSGRHASSDQALSVYVRRLTFSALSDTGELQASETELAEVNRPDAAMGRSFFAVAWSGLTSDGMGGVYARRFNAAGQPLEGELHVTADPIAAEQAPAVAVAPDDALLVAWAGATADGSRAIFLQAFNADGVSSEPAVQVSSATRETPLLRDLALDQRGNIVVSWSAPGASGLQSVRLPGSLAQAGVVNGYLGPLPFDAAVTTDPWNWDRTARLANYVASGEANGRLLLATAALPEVAAADASSIANHASVGRHGGSETIPRGQALTPSSGRAFSASREGSVDGHKAEESPASNHLAETASDSQPGKKHSALPRSHDLPIAAHVLDAPLSEPPPLTPPPAPPVPRSRRRRPSAPA